MRSLQTLVVTKRYCFQHETTSPVYDPVLGILFESIIRRPANSLRRLWIDDNHCGYSTYNGIGIIAGESAVTSSVTSLVVSRTNLGDNMELILANERFRHLKHLGCLRFKRLVQLPDLQYACGDWDGYDNVMDSFYTFCLAYNNTIKRHSIVLRDLNKTSGKIHLIIALRKRNFFNYVYFS